QWQPGNDVKVEPVGLKDVYANEVAGFSSRVGGLVEERIAFGKILFPGLDIESEHAEHTAPQRYVIERFVEGEPFGAELITFVDVARDDLHATIGNVTYGLDYGRFLFVRAQNDLHRCPGHEHVGSMVEAHTT